MSVDSPKHRRVFRTAMRESGGPKPPSTLLDHVVSIGQYRDAVLVLASVIYVLGYLSWAFYAADNDLGMVPALDTQYLVAGILPLIILGVGIGLSMLQLRFSRWSASDPSPRRYWWAAALSYTGFGLIVGGFLASYFLSGLAEHIATQAGVVGAYVLMAGSLLQGSRGIILFRFYALGLLWIIVVFIPFILLLAYFENVFPYVPAALGGPSPRCVVVDLATQEVSSNTLAALLPQNAATSTPTAAPTAQSTRSLELIFSSPEFVMLRVKDQGRHAPVYSIAKHAILALAPCPEDIPEYPSGQ